MDKTLVYTKEDPLLFTYDAEKRIMECCKSGWRNGASNIEKAKALYTAHALNNPCH